ncbi:hypothetical protein AVEN_253532-1 [Araneus ventricosus]|uniref:Uncharacterized protein n=1 Tax=Araneus ventricosus TaxID=182803 RepID=A0A4Y2BTD9_ARAVE|nr:hypothetical protein AVEN_253532-1 [Araneus ventricosus]
MNFIQRQLQTAVNSITEWCNVINSSLVMIGFDGWTGSDFRLGSLIRTKQEDDPDIIQNPADLSDENHEAWINIDSNLEKAEKLQKKQNDKHG